MTTSRLTMRATLAAITVGIALGGTVAAQTTQADPDHAVHHPEGAVTAQAAPPAAVPPSSTRGAPGRSPGTGSMGGPGMMMGGRGMMGRGGDMMGAPDEGGRRRMMMHHGAGGAPMNVIINVGPGIRVDVDDDGRDGGRRGMGMAPPAGTGMMGSGTMGPGTMAPGTMGPGTMAPGMMGMTMELRGGAMGPGALRHFERIDAHLAYVRAVLRVTEAQAPQWSVFADAARAAAERLRQAYAQVIQAAQPATAPAQLEGRIALLSVQLDATRTMMAAAGPLYEALSDEQKRTADELLAEHLQDMRRRGL
ncbi:MAG: Spy/CpxP family protein refolding chaperone [Alphaproteobacteria bacterium]|nr:Spy/CpxP family protein refolding chaperone [Alphaproteobacteria bacterium]